MFLMSGMVTKILFYVKKKWVRKAFWVERTAAEKTQLRENIKLIS